MCGPRLSASSRVGSPRDSKSAADRNDGFGGIGAHDRPILGKLIREAEKSVCVDVPVNRTIVGALTCHFGISFSRSGGICQFRVDWIGWLKAGHFAELGLRVVLLALRAKRDPQLVVTFRIVGVRLEKRYIFLDRPLDIAGIEQGYSQVLVQKRHLRRPGNGLAKNWNGLLELTITSQRQSECNERRLVPWVYPQCFSILWNRFVVALLSGQCDSEDDVSLRASPDQSSDAWRAWSSAAE